MSRARDTPEERLAEYGELLRRALLGRKRRDDAVVLVYRVEADGDQVRWTTTNTVHGDQRAAVDVMLDAMYELPDHAGSDIDGYLARLAERGIKVVSVGSGFQFG